jgi:hypothetical protein
VFAISPTLKGLHLHLFQRSLKPMSQSLAKILIHTVFSTKERRPFLHQPALRQELHKYLGGILKQRDCQPILVGGWKTTSICSPHYRARMKRRS